MPGRVDLSKPYGGSLQFTPTGDIAVVLDTIDEASATKLRLEHMLQTNPRIVDDAGNPISYADDPFHADYGAGLGASVGEPVERKTVDDVAARIAHGLALTSGVSDPSDVTVTDLGGGFVQINIDARDLNGNPIPVPSYKLQILGG